MTSLRQYTSWLSSPFCARHVPRPPLLSQEAYSSAILSPSRLLAALRSLLWDCPCKIKVWDYRLLRLEEIVVAHRQEITCVRFLDPLPCLATADMTGKVLLWATRPHPNGGALLTVIRNTVITAGDPVPEVARGLSGGGLPRARGQRKVLPTPVTCIAFRHHKPSECAPAETAAAQRARQNQQVAAAARAVAAEKTLATAVEAGSGHQDDETSSDSSATGTPKIPATPPPSSPWEVGSILFTGDELGYVKVWDLTDVLLDKLGPTACGATASEDKAAIPPAFFGTVSHHFVHYREGPLDGVGLQAGVRFRELIDIARMLRRGEHLQAAKPEPSEEDDTISLRRADLDSSGGGRVLGGGGKKKKKINKRFEAKSSAGSLSTSSSTAERSRDRSSAGRSKGWVGGGPSNLLAPPTATAPPDARDSKQRARSRRLGPKEQAEATLNATPDDIHPVASWMGHEDCVTSMQTIASPLSIVTGSLDSSARLFSLDGSLLGVMSEKQNDRETERAWIFQPPAKGRTAEASARGAALEKTLQHVRHEERQPVVRPGVSGAAAAPGDTPGQGRCTLSSHPGKAPNHGSELGMNFADSKRQCASPPAERRVGAAPASPAGDAVGKGVEEKGGEVTPERRDCLQAQLSISALCLSRISELKQGGRVAEVAASSDTGSDNPLRTAEDGIEARLLSEAREGREYQRTGVCARQVPPQDNQEPLKDARTTGYHHTAKPSSAASEPPAPLKLPPNLSAERERKQARRTRSTLQFLSNSVNRTSGAGGSISSFSCSSIKSQSQNDAVKGPRVMTERTQGGGARVRSRPFTSPGTRAKSPEKNRDRVLARDDSATTLIESTALSPAAKLRHAVMVAAPYLALRLEGTSGKQMPPSNHQGGGEGQQADAGGAGTGRGGAGGDERGGVGGTPQKTERAERGETTPPTTLAAAAPLTQKSSAPKMVLTQRSTANLLFTQRSARTLLSARSNRSNKSCLSMTTRPAAVSTKAAVARRMAADRRLRRMDGILDGVRRLGQRQTAAAAGAQFSLTSRAADGDRARRGTTVVEEEEGGGTAGGTGPATSSGGLVGAGTVVVSARIREVLSRFERSVNGGGDGEDDDDIEFNNRADQRAKNMRRQLEARTAAREEAIRHNERYRRAQRYDLVTLQETQLRRQEAMVGLAGPSGERFGPYTYVSKHIALCVSP